MSGVAVVRYVLAHTAAVIAEVPATRIFAGVVPLKTPLPAIGITQISGTERLTVSMRGAKKLRTERVQVTVEADSYLDQKALLELVRIPNQNGLVNDIDVDSILPAGEGPDLYDMDARIFSQSRDFFVTWRST